MKYVRAMLDGRLVHGILENVDTIRLLKGDPFRHPAGALEGMKALTDALVPLDEAWLLAPVTPSKILCAGLNYVDHIRETHSATPETPVIFMKPPTAVVGPGCPVVYPSISRHVEYEGELAVVIGRCAPSA